MLNRGGSTPNFHLTPGGLNSKEGRYLSLSLLKPSCFFAMFNRYIRTTLIEMELQKHVGFLYYINMLTFELVSCNVYPIPCLR